MLIVCPVRRPSARAISSDMIDPSLISLLGIVLIAGAAAGFAAGMFGIGGGIVIVPTLYYIFNFVGPEGGPHMKVAVATSLATIVLTSVRSVMAHNKRGAVDWPTLKLWGAWIVAGALMGGITSRFVDGDALTALFGGFGLIIAATMGLSRPTPNSVLTAPVGALRIGLGFGLGFASAWLGIGGGVFGVIILTMAGAPIHVAVGTASGFGVAIGLPGAIGAMISGLGAENLPAYSIGYVNIPAFAAIAAMTGLTAPLGARVAHGLSQSLLKRIFAVALAIIASRMLWSGVSALLGH